MSTAPTTSNSTPELPEDALVLDARDEALLAKIGGALQAERQVIQAQSTDFKARLLTKVNANAARRISSRTSRSGQVIRPSDWTRNLKYYAAAVLFIGVTLGLVAMSGLLGTGENLHVAQPDIRAARITADRIPLNMNGGETAASDLFKPYDQQKMKLVIDTQDGEACLALIPQAAIDRDYDALQKQALLSHPNWDVTVEAGRISLPPQAYSQALGSVNSNAKVYLLKIAGHYEIWTAEALQRYVERNQKQPGTRSELRPAPALEELHG